MRPRYENKKDRSNELEIISICAERWRCAFRKLKMSLEIDYALLREEKICAVVEIKDRSLNYSSQYMRDNGGYLLSAQKYQTGMQWVERHGCPFILVVRLSDGIFWRKWDEVPTHTIPIKFKGRRDRNDKDDEEPCIFISMSEFRELVIEESKNAE